ncbi:unnamed protein product, partial [marine sediment metagenome]
GANVRQPVTGETNSTQGRFPSNFVMSHHEECELKDGTETVDAYSCHPECPVKMLDEQSGLLKRGGDCTNSGYQDKYVGGKVKQIVDTFKPKDAGGASRFFYTAKPSKKEKNAGCDTNNHPTVKSKKLMSYLIRMITPPGGTILDPFTGSGSTGIAALEEGFKFFGIEKEEEYTKIAKARLEYTLTQLKRED